MGIYWPQVTAEGLRRFSHVSEIAMVPMPHPGDDLGRVRRAVGIGVVERLTHLFCRGAVEEAFLAPYLGRDTEKHSVPHLAAPCAIRGHPTALRAPARSRSDMGRFSPRARE